VTNTIKNPFLQIDRAIVGDIYTSREVMDNLTVLCDDFGARFAGTPDEKRAAEFIAETFRRYGLQEVRLEPFAYSGWTRGAATLEIVEPIQKTIPCISLPYCPATEVTAELVSVGYGSPDDFKKLGKKLRGRIVLADSASARGQRWVHRKEKYERTVMAGGRAFIFVSETAGIGPETGSLQNDRPAPIAGISVCYEDGLFLKRLMERRGKVTLRLRTTDVNEPRTSWNVVGELRGTEKPRELVILGSHYDGHDISQGAVDPASGTVVVMEAARVLAAHARRRLKRTVRFIAYGVEELGLTGSSRYVEAHARELDRIRFVLNLDSAGGGRNKKGIVVHDWPKLVPFLENAAKEMRAEMPVVSAMGAHSDHFPFLLKGIVTGGVGDFGGGGTGGRGFGHTAYDTLDKVELVGLRDASAVAARIALRIANAEKFPAKRRSAAVVKKIVATAPELEGHRVEQQLEKSSKKN
jgi:Zn-dependent M28 family amino/carboxypeptidase